MVCFNERKIASLRASVPASSTLAAATTRYKALAHPVRLAILAVLRVESCCVCDLANVLDVPVSTLSQHLKALRQAGLVASRQEGKLVFYSLMEDARRELRTVGAEST